jgi:electron transfer flavoprotein alpha subunit|eukprot:g4051.t1 g4051   contig15:239804-240964(-)
MISILRSTSVASSAYLARRAAIVRSSTAAQRRSESTLVVAEPTTDSSLAPSTLAAITAASKLHSGPISLLTFTPASAVPSSVTSVIEANTTSGVGNSNKLAETVTNAVVAANEKHGYSHIVAAGTKFGANYLGRAGAQLGVSPVSDVVEVLSGDTFVRPLYAGNALAKVISKDSPLTLISIRPTAFEKAEATGESANTESLDVPANELTEWLLESVSKSERPDLGSASVVVSGGRGMKNGENFALLEALADKLKGAVGASRAAVDAGFVPNDLQVGQTGKVVAPDLYIAVGISGAIQHLSGMKDSKTIVAINKDGDAPIFQVADFGLVADLFDAVPELTEKLQ